ncbi:MAG: helix-turn-helix domain-containing protein, partial [Pseudonocardiaceae bacterium]
MSPVRGPVVPRRRLGAELRTLRERAGLTIDEVAKELECSVSKVSRLETGQGIPKSRDVRDLVEL